MTSPDAHHLRTHLERLKVLRGAGSRAPPRLAELKAWQSARLQRTYPDFISEPRYKKATAFFIDDLYGPKDFSGRDEAMLRIFPMMTRILPQSAVETASLAIELEAVSEDLDHRVALALAPGAIGDEHYAAAYRAAGTPKERQHQIDLVLSVGARLDALVRKPLVAGTLKLMHRPAHLAGLQDLQDFLERGFDAFRDMGGAADFLATIRAREELILARLFSGTADPFSV